MVKDAPVTRRGTLEFAHRADNRTIAICRKVRGPPEPGGPSSTPSTNCSPKKSRCIVWEALRSFTRTASREPPTMWILSAWSQVHCDNSLPSLANRLGTPPKVQRVPGPRHDSDAARRVRGTVDATLSRGVRRRVKLTCSTAATTSRWQNSNAISNAIGRMCNTSHVPAASNEKRYAAAAMWRCVHI